MPELTAEWLKTMVNIGRDDVYQYLDKHLESKILTKLHELVCLSNEAEPDQWKKRTNWMAREYDGHFSRISGTLIRFLRKKYAVSKNYKTASEEAVERSFVELNELLDAINGRDSLKVLANGKREISVLDSPLNENELIKFAAEFPSPDLIESDEDEHFPDRIKSGGKYYDKMPFSRRKRDVFLQSILPKEEAHLNDLINEYNQLRFNPASISAKIVEAWRGRLDLAFQVEIQLRAAWIKSEKGNIQRIKRLLNEPIDLVTIPQIGLFAQKESSR